MKRKDPGNEVTHEADKPVMKWVDMSHEAAKLAPKNVSHEATIRALFIILATSTSDFVFRGMKLFEHCPFVKYCGGCILDRSE